MVYSNVDCCTNVVVGWRSGVRRHRLCVRCEGCCSLASLEGLKGSKHVGLFIKSVLSDFSVT